MGLEYEYIPHKIIGIRKRMQERYPGENREAYSQQTHNKRFEELIQEIKEEKRENLGFYSRWLTEKDVFLLANRFGSLKSEETRSKVLEIFNVRGSEQIIKKMFKAYMENWQDILLNGFLLGQLENKRVGFLPVVWIKILQSPRIEEFIGNYICSKIQSVVDTFQELGIEKETLLVYESKYRAYLHGNMDFFNAQDSSYLLNDLSLFKLEQLKKVAEQYLLVMNQDQLNNDLMVFFLKKIGRPVEKNLNWNDITKPARDKFRNWYFTSELERFFSNDIRTGKERFNFWEQYLADIKNLRFEENELVLIMDFGRHVVVEFGRTGNAAYIYSKDVFLRCFGDFEMAINLKKEQLKDQKTAKDRILHSGYWQGRASFKMGRILIKGE